MLLGIFAHVDADHRFLAIEQVFGQLFGNMGLADAGRPDEHEYADRTVGVLQPGPAAADGPRYAGNGLVLSDDDRCEVSVHLFEPALFAVRNVRYRNTRHRSDHFADRLLVDLYRTSGHLLFPLRFHLLQAAAQRAFTVFQRGGRVVILHSDRSVLFGAYRLDVAFHRGQRFGRLDFEHVGAAARFVHHVDRFVREEAVGHVALRQVDAGFQRRFGIMNAVVRFVVFLDVVQHTQRLFGRRLFHDDLLKTPLQRAVALDIFAVFAQGGGSDALQFAPGQRRFQDVGRVERPLRAAGADDRVDFVDKEDHVAAGEFLQQQVDPFFELSAVFRPCDQRGDVQREDPFAQQCVRDFLLRDPQRQPFDDGRLPDARFADQHRVVLFAPAEDLDHPFDFGVPADHRVEFAFGRAVGQVDAELAEHTVFGRRLPVGHGDTHYSRYESFGVFSVLFAEQREILHILVVVLVGRHVAEVGDDFFRSHIVQHQYPRAARAAVVDDDLQQVSRVTGVLHHAGAGHTHLLEQRVFVETDVRTGDVERGVRKNDRAQFPVRDVF